MPGHSELPFACKDVKAIVTTFTISTIFININTNILGHNI